MNIKRIAAIVLAISAASAYGAESELSTADSPSISLSQWWGPSSFTMNRQMGNGDQKMLVVMPLTTFKTIAEIVSRAREKQNLVLAISESTLKALNKLAPSLKDSDPIINFSEGGSVLQEGRVLQEGALEIGPGETKHITVRIGIPETYYFQLTDKQKKEFEKLLQGANLEATKADKQ
jgi:hypothetical protein